MTHYCDPKCTRCEYYAGGWRDTCSSVSAAQFLNFCPSCGRGLLSGGETEPQVARKVAVWLAGTLIGFQRGLTKKVATVENIMLIAEAEAAKGAEHGNGD